MVSCLILYHSTITNLTKCKILRAIFHVEEFELNVIDPNTVNIYIWNVNKEEILQAVDNLETTDIELGYGFGNRKIDAKIEAEKVVENRLFIEGDKPSYSHSYKQINSSLAVDYNDNPHNPQGAIKL